MSMRLLASVNIRIFFLIVMVTAALRPAEKYLGEAWLWVPYAGLATMLLILVALPSMLTLRRLLRSSSFHWFVIAALAVVSSAFYPAADALKVIRQGQDQDDCTILGVQSLLVFSNPVSTPTYFGNPCSNLLGAIVPHTPFVLLGNMGLAGPAFLALAVLFLKLTKAQPLTIGVTLAILAGTPATLELMVNGSDFVFIGAAILVVSRTLLLLGKGKLSGARWLWLVAILSAAVGTTRINMLLFIAVAGLVHLALRLNIIPLIVASTLAILPNALIYLADPEAFAPLHLVAKGQGLVPGILYLVMLSMTLGALVVGLVKPSVLRNHSQEYVLVAFGLHLLFLAYGDLVFNRQFDFFWWEGANYLYLLTPLSVLIAAESLFSRADKEEEVRVDAA